MGAARWGLFFLTVFVAGCGAQSGHDSTSSFPPGELAQIESSSPASRARIYASDVGEGNTRFEVTFYDNHARPLYATPAQVRAELDGQPVQVYPLPPATSDTVEAQNKALPPSKQYEDCRYDKWVCAGNWPTPGTHELVAVAAVDTVQSTASTTWKTSVMQARTAAFYGKPMLPPWPPITR